MSTRTHSDPVTITAAVFFLFLMPCAILLSGVRMVPVLSYIDPWLYIGGFLNLEDLYERFGRTYYMSRLPWLLLGKAAHSILPTVIAHVTMGFLVYFSLNGALFAIIRRFYRMEIALFVAAVGATSPLAIYHSFWAHVDVPSISVALLAVASLVYADGDRIGRMGFLAGALFAVAVTTHLFSVVVFAPAAVITFVLRFRETWFQALLLCASAVAGFCVVIGILAAAADAVYGDPWFWLAQITTARWVVSGGWHNWAKPIGQWAPGGALVIPFSLIASSLLLLSRYRELKKDPAVRFLFLYIWIILAIFLITDFGMGGARLQHPWYYSFLLFPSLLLLGPLLHHTLKSTRTIRICWLIYAFLAVAALLTIGILQVRYTASAIILLSAALLLVLVLVFVRIHAIKAGAAVILSCLLFLSCAYARELPEVFAGTNQWKDLSQSVEIYEGVLPHLEERRAVRFFYNNKPSTRYLFNSVNALYLWGYSMLSDELPAIREDRRKHLNRPSSVVILAKDEADVDAGLKRLKELYYLESVPVRETLISRDETFQLAIAHASPRKP